MFRLITSLPIYKIHLGKKLLNCTAHFLVVNSDSTFYFIVFKVAKLKVLFKTLNVYTMLKIVQ